LQHGLEKVIEQFERSENGIPLLLLLLIYPF
jgi:hypothetical protein